jgi:hypothetical protein
LKSSWRRWKPGWRENAEVNQIAQVIGKPPAETSRRLSAQLIEERTTPPGATTHIARALAGKFGR